MANASIDTIELSYSFEKDVGFDICKQIDYTDKTDILLWSFHLPWHHELCNIAHMNKDMRQNAVEMDKEIIKKCVSVGIKYGVIHPFGEPISINEKPL